MPAAPIVLSGLGEYRAAEKHCIITRNFIRRDGFIRPCVHCHGRSSTGLEPLDARGYDFPKTNFRTAATGIPVACGDLIPVATQANYAHWGRDDALAGIDALLSYVAAREGVRTDQIVMSGNSMGVLTCLNYARANPGKVLAVLGQFPALDMTDAGLSGYQTDMDAAYGSHAAWTAALATHNPVAYAASMTVPTRLLYSVGDTVARPAPVLAYAAAAANVETRAIASAGAHVVSPLSSDEIAWAADWLTGKAQAA